MSKDSSVPDSISVFIHQKEDSEWSVQVINPTQTEPMQNMAENLFGGLNIELEEIELEGVEDDLFLVIQDDQVVASSPLKTLKDTLLLVNSDLYTTGTKSIEEVNIPETVQTLTDTVFTLSGFPESNTEKLVLTLVSRHIEQQAMTSETGILRSSFQRLSRLDDEQGTREVYNTLGQRPDLDVHVYGFPDWDPPSEMGVTAHPVRNEEIRKTWFVVYTTEAGTDRAMLATKVGPNTWKGYWTLNSPEIQAIDSYITQTY